MSVRNNGEKISIRAEESTIDTVLKQAGSATAWSGK